MRTNDLKKLVQTQLKTVTAKVYHEVADKDAVYQHLVFSFRRIDLNDLSRQDYVLQVDVWDRDDKTQRVDDLADEVENLLQAQNLPQQNILPTFYLIDRKTVEDEDKMIRHRQIQFQVQNYERS
jgi:hypothetical protein